MSAIYKQFAELQLKKRKNEEKKTTTTTYNNRVKSALLNDGAELSAFLIKNINKKYCVFADSSVIWRSFVTSSMDEKGMYDFRNHQPPSIGHSCVCVHVANTFY